MSKKPFEHFDKRIKEAAENSEPPFDEQAWGKMEALLNKEDDKKRRPFLWFWFTLPVIFIAAVGTYFFVNKKPSNEVTTNADQSTFIQQVKKNKSETSTIADSSYVSKPTNTEVDNNTQPLNPANSNTIKKAYSTFNADIAATQSNTNGYGKTKKIKKKINGSINSIQKAGEASELDNDGTVTINNQNKISDTAGKNILPIPVSNETKILAIDGSTEKKDSLPVKNTIAQKETPAKTLSKQKLSKFYLLASIGVDASSVQLFSFKNSTIAPRYGVGAGYQLSKKISIQTGFYAGHKKYIAGPGSYHPKEGSFLDSVDITKVNANCLVFEIPITIRYNFLQKPTVNYYITAGVSSFIMKKEDYNYYYLWNNYPTTDAYSYTGNKNLFSILSFSAGIEKKLSTQLSLQAEPSINIPIAGVGEGSVKLYSAGIQVGIKYIP
jgi:hypothetical protein